MAQIARAGLALDFARGPDALTAQARGAASHPSPPFSSPACRPQARVGLLAAGSVVALQLALRSRRRPRPGRRHVQRNVAQVFEFFSGIGGLRTSYQLATGSTKEDWPLWRAMEVDLTCCNVYSSVYSSSLRNGVRSQELWLYTPGRDEVWRCSIDKLPDAAFEGGDLWLMGPPCQPFTRTGNKLDIEDKRCAALLRLVEALPRLSKPPRGLLVENIPEFATSKAYARLRAALEDYELEEFVLDPMDFGFPNSRRRFYLLASRQTQNTKKSLPPFPGMKAPKLSPRPVAEFCGHRQLQGEDDSMLQQLRVSKECLLAATDEMWQLDIATASSTVTKTFMGSYGKPKYRGGLSISGPLLLTEESSPEPAAAPRKRFGVPEESLWPRLRYFAPKEVLALHGYPDSWKMPKGVDLRAQWRLIGNSVNVEVVKHLMMRLLAKL